MWQPAAAAIIPVARRQPRADRPTETMIRKTVIGCGAALMALAPPLHALEGERLGAPAEDTIMLGADDDAGAFGAAGFTLQSDGWHGCDDPGTASYVPGQIEQLADLNGDGLPEAIISEASTYCFGNVGMGFSLVSKQADGVWKLLASGQGIATVLSTRGVGNWPDLEIGGPGFCFPVMRWNGTEYAPHRREYDGKPC